MRYWICQFFTRPHVHRSAFSEVAITAIIALIPLIITAIVKNYRNSDVFDFSSTLEQAVGGGQLYLYAYGLLGAILWLAFFKADKPMHGPRRLLGFITMVVAFFIFGLLGLDPTISNAKNLAILRGSYWAYGLFLFINYLLLFYHDIDPPSAEDSLKKGAEHLKSRYLGGQYVEK